MICFCADDYGISEETCRRIERCAQGGMLNKISVLPNMCMLDFKERLSGKRALSLHLNLVEGKPLSAPEDIELLVSQYGCFKYSFFGLFLLSLSPKRKALAKQIYHEVVLQLRFWKEHTDAPFSIDSHQHTHMIPLVFKTLMRAIRDEGIRVDYLRIPQEPILPYLLTPSLYLTYRPVNLIKQWLLRFLVMINAKEIKKENFSSAYFMGILFSGKMDAGRICKVLPHYVRLAKKNNKDIELNFHPGYTRPGEKLPEQMRKGFLKFYLSKHRKTEYDALIQLKNKKEACE